MNRASLLAMAGVAVVLSICTVGSQQSRQKGAVIPAVGPRGPVGPDVPLSGAEKKRFAKCIIVQGHMTAAIEAACDRAIKEGIGVVYLPPGVYLFKDESVSISNVRNLTLLGTGSKTHLKTDKSDPMFRLTNCEKVRFTRMRIEGADTSFATSNNTWAIRFENGKDLRVDHCENFGFARGIGFGSGVIGQVDHCVIHNNARSGLGYGVLIYGGSKVLVCDNVMWSCRHCVTSNSHNTHYTFRHNYIKHDKNLRPGDNISCIDVHSGMKNGTIVVEHNLIENVRNAVGAWAGVGLYRGNVFKNIRLVAIWHTGDGAVIEDNNTFINVAAKHKGKVISKEDAPSFPILRETGQEYVKQAGRQEEG